MNNFTIDGISTGLDTTSIINSLLSIERAPITRMQAQQSRVGQELVAWQEIEQRLENLRTAAENLSTASSFDVFQTTSSNESAATGSAAAGAAPGRLAFQVRSLARSQQLLQRGGPNPIDQVAASRVALTSGLETTGIALVSSSRVGPDSPLPDGPLGRDVGPVAADVAAGTYEIEVVSVSDGEATVVFGNKTQTVASTGFMTLVAADGAELDIEAGDDGLAVGTASIAVHDTDGTSTVQEFTAEINRAAGPASVSVIDTGAEGPERFALSIAATGTGTAGAVAVHADGTDLFDDLEEVVTAQDAELDFADGNISLSRSTNTITDVAAGVTIDLHRAEPGEEIVLDIGHDQEQIVADVQAVVEALNAVLSSAARHLRADPENQISGALAGDSRLRRVVSQLQGAVRYSEDSGPLRVASQLGISLQRGGAYQLDEPKLREALERDFGGVVDLLSAATTGRDGIFAAIDATVDDMTDTRSGAVGVAIETAKGAIDGFDDAIVAKERRMELVEIRLRRQYAALETLIGQLNTESGRLTSAISQLG